MKIRDTEMPGVRLIEPDVFEDARGLFFESWAAERYASAGLPVTFVQDNVSRSRRGVLRGLHLQNPDGQGKLVSVLEGEVFDVAVDVRPDSPSFRRWIGVVLSSANRRQLWIPEGFAHGFCVTSDEAIFHYKCTAPYRRESELAVSWADPELAIDWPVREPLLNAKDAEAPVLRDIPVTRLPRLFPATR